MKTKPVETFSQRSTHQHKWYSVTRNCSFSITSPVFLLGYKNITKREAPQLDLDETIHAEMARESGADSTNQTKVRFVTRQSRTTASSKIYDDHEQTAADHEQTAIHAAGNQHPLSKTQRRSLTRKKAKEKRYNQTTPAPEQGRAQRRTPHPAPQIITHFGK